MQEVTIKLTLEEARAINVIIGNKFDESYSTAAILKATDGKVPEWLDKQIQMRSNIYDKINAAIDASY